METIKSLLINISNAINAFQRIGIDIETIIEETTEEYIGDGAKNPELKKHLQTNFNREYISIDTRIGMKFIEGLPSADQETRRILYEHSKLITRITVEYIKANLETQYHYKSIYDFLAEIKKRAGR